MITDLDLDPSLFETAGLQHIRMQRLSRVVVLAGPNGGGKSRLLAAVEKASRAAQEERRLFPEGPRAGAVQVTAPPHHHPTLISYALAVQTVRVASMTPQQFGRNLGETHGGIQYDRVQMFVEVYLTWLAKGIFLAEHPSAPREVASDVNHSASVFNDILTALLGTRLGYTSNDWHDVRPTLFGRPFEPAELSSGQMVLLYWASILSRRPEPLRNGIVCIDEPELHLHPAAANDAINKLLNDLLGEGGQIWVATHSLPLIAELCSRYGLDSLYYVANGAAQHAGSAIATVTESLLGGENARETVLSFLGTSDEVAFAHFAAECLSPATVASHFQGDRQALQVADRIRTSEGPLRVLDHCAGRGRLAAALADTLTLDWSKLTYSTYHDLRFSTETEVRECALVLRRLADRGATVHMYFANGEFEELGVAASDWREGTRAQELADVVLLANTLHEVPVTAWSAFLRRIQQLSKANGHVLLVEDQEPRIGELPTPSGFLILNQLELERLFRAEQPLPRVQSRDGRLTIHEIPCRLLSNVTNSSIHDAIDMLIDRVKERITTIRASSAATRGSGRRHALYAMTLANAFLAKDELPARDAT